MHSKFPVYWMLTRKPIGEGDSVILRKTCEYLERLGFIESTDHHIYTLSPATQATLSEAGKSDSSEATEAGTEVDMASEEQAEEPKAEVSVSAAKPLRAAPKTPAKRPAKEINAAKARKAAK